MTPRESLELHVPEAFTASIRRRVTEASGRCPTCGQATTEGGQRALADSIGVKHTVLWRFLRGGDITGRNLDKLVAWLDAK